VLHYFDDMKLTNANETKKSLVLIVDDEACVRESLSSLIRSVGYKTKEYASAEDFLTRGWWDRAACVILDVRMPGMGGLELQRYLAQKKSEQPIILISGHATEDEQTWSMRRGAVAFLRKPFSDESLLAAIRKSISQGSAGFDLHPELRRNQICPLCHESAQVAEIPRRFIRDHGDLYASTVEMIKTLHPQWTEQDGLCWRCWRFYVGLGRVGEELRSQDDPQDKTRGPLSAAVVPSRKRECQPLQTGQQ
jgi:CheY-like chemotaxis protein